MNLSRELLAHRLLECDPTDNYHDGDGEIDARSYYLALDRAVRFVRGDLESWATPPRQERK